MKGLSLWLSIAAAFAFSTGLFGGQAPATTRIDVSKLGPQVGQMVPDFSLRDQDGKIWTLRSLMGQKGLMLVFVRSADWCPYCKTQLTEIQTRVDEVRNKGLGLAAISYDSQEILAAFSKQRGITFPLLSDAGSVTIKKFGILNPLPELALGPGANDPAIQAEVQRLVSAGQVQQRHVGIALPGTFFIDPNGKVTSRFFEDFYTERNTVSSLLLKAGDGSASVVGTQAATAHFDLRTYPSDPVIAPGNRFSLAVEIKPKPGLHLYAPGAKNYRVVSLKLNVPAWVRVLDMKYPASETYHFKPLNETVPVYQKPFTLVQELILDGSPQAQAQYRGRDSLVLSGTLEYQACDETTCYVPGTLPMTWTLNLRNLVTERPTPTP